MQHRRKIRFQNYETIPHEYQRLPVVSANTIITFEKENKVNLPESYRTY